MRAAFGDDLVPCYYICVLILLYMCPHTTICVLILLYMCPHILSELPSDMIWYLAPPQKKMLWKLLCIQKILDRSNKGIEDALA
jgi:hypothetical protein